jgi:hypothetical protein
MWCFLYGPRTKCKSSRWKSIASSRKIKCRHHCSEEKLILEVSFDRHGIIHNEFIPKWATVNNEKYMEGLHCLEEAITWKQPDTWFMNFWILLHNTSATQCSILVQHNMAKHDTVLPHLPNSPDIVLCNFSLFVWLKKALYHHIHQQKGCQGCYDRNSQKRCVTELLPRLLFPLADVHKVDGNYFEVNCS